jgi:outer membrane protein assembly factor BamB
MAPNKARTAKTVPALDLAPAGKQGGESVSDSEQYQKVACPSCGGSILPEDDLAECPFCGTVLERTRPSVSVTQIQLGQSIPIQTTVQPTSATRIGIVVAVAIGLFILAISGFIAWFFLHPEGPIAGARALRGTPFLIPDDREGPADVLVVTYNVNDETNVLTCFDSAQGKIRWESPTLSEDAYRVSFVVDGSRVYVADQASLLALSRDDGSLIWQAPLADTLGTTCEGCLRQLSGYVAALSEDGTLQAFEASTGRPAWSFRLNETARRLHVLDGHLAAFDQADPEDWRSQSLFLWDPATGDLARRINVRCDEERHTETPDRNGPILVDPSGKQIYLLYGLTPGCAQKWDLGNGQLIWQTTADYYFDHFDTVALLTADTIYGSDAGVIVTVDTATGELHQLSDSADHDLVPLAVHEDTLVASAKRTRGSKRYELWGLDTTTGTRRWQIILEEDGLLEESGSWHDPAWTAHLTREGLTVLHLLDEPPRLIVETIDPQTGTSKGKATNDLDDDYWDAAIWANDTVWLVTRKLHAVDLSTGQVLLSWP